MSDKTGVGLATMLAATMLLGAPACTSDQTPAEPAGDPNLARATASSYSAVDLGVLGGPSSVAQDISPAGQIVGGSLRADGLSSHPFLWEKGVMTDLGTLGGNLGTALGINPRGQVVGSTFILPAGLTNALHAFLWEDGVMSDLGTLGGSESQATAINPAGQVVGFSHTEVEETHAFLWQKGVMVDLGVGEPTVIDPTGESAATDINPAGAVVGSMSTALGTHAFLWDKGAVTDLGTLGGCCSFANAIDPAGRVVGYSYLEGNEVYHAFLWEKGAMIDLGTLGETSEARDINPKGQIVGTSGNRAFLWENGVLAELISLDRRFDSAAEAINPAGQIVGYSNTVAGLRATLWTLK